MAKFPTKENDVVELANNIKNGLGTHGADFPNLDPMELTTALASYNASKSVVEDARSASSIATASKKDAVEDLTALMKKMLKQAEVDCVSDPQKLTEIGWAPKAPLTPAQVPFMPTYLNAVEQGPGTLMLQWKRSAYDSNRPVNNYIVQRREIDSSGGYTEWILVDSCIKNESYLIGQPRGIQMEYRVIATNGAGNSEPSNIAPVVL